MPFSESIIIAEHTDFFVINKPANCHSVIVSRTDGSPCLAAWLLSQYPYLKSAAKKEGDAGLVQRLDFETSGIIIAAKNPKAWEVLSAALKEPSCKKKYTAIVSGIPDSKKFIIKGYIGASGKSQKMVRFFTEEERIRAKFSVLYCETEIEVEKEFPEKQQTRVSATISKGARHQIRVSLAHIGHPLFGDTLYGGGTSNSGFFLKSQAVTFNYLGKEMHYTLLKDA